MTPGNGGRILESKNDGQRRLSHARADGCIELNSEVSEMRSKQDLVTWLQVAIFGKDFLPEMAISSLVEG